MELSIYDANALAKYEAIIERGMAEFVAVGEALLSIRNQRLYRATHNSFEAYCADKWGMSRRRADQLIGASQTVLLLTDSVDEEPRTNSSQFPSDEVGNNVSHFLPKNERPGFRWIERAEDVSALFSGRTAQQVYDALMTALEEQVSAQDDERSA